MDPMHFIQDAMQMITMLLCIITLFIGFLWTRRNKLRMQWSIPIATWVFHRLIFYAYVQLSAVYALPSGFFGFWTTIVSFHGIVVTLMTIFTLNLLNGKVLK